MENQQVDAKKKHIRKQNFTALAILIIGTILSLLILGPKKSDKTESKQVAQAVKVVKIIKISRADSSRANLEKTIKFNASNSGEAVAEYSGRIDQVNFSIGDFVSKGQTLALFNQSESSNVAKVSFESAQKSLELAEENFKQTKKIAEESVELAKSAVNIAEIQLNQARDDGDKDAINLAKESLEIAEDQKDQAKASSKAQINGASIQVEQARLGLNQAQIGYNKTFIKSPISGYVISKDIDKDDYINIGTTVAQIAKEGKLKGSIYLNQNEVERISKEDAVEIVFNKKSYSGKLSSISNIANEANQRFEAIIETDQNLIQQANQSAMVRLSLKLKNEQGFFIPLEAVNIGQNKNEVFVSKDGKAMAKEVKIGEIIGKQVEITEGLKENDLVVVEGNRNLQEGEAVKSAIGN